MEIAVVMKDIFLRYRLPKERIRSFKEFVIKSLKKRIEYEDFWALRGVSLKVYKGEMIGIIGSNGSGKSTLLKVVSRILRPLKGTVIVNGKVSPLIELGAGFDLELTGRENVFLFGSILGMGRREIESKYEDIVAFAELEDFMDAPLRTYSSGMMVRLGFAIATSVDADILLLDEVLAVGDEAFKQKCKRLITDFRQRGVTILFVSHDLENVKIQCDKALWLEKGKVMSYGSPQDVVEQYINYSKRHIALVKRT